IRNIRFLLARWKKRGILGSGYHFMRCRLFAIAVAVACLLVPPARADLLLSGGGANAVQRWDGVGLSPFASDPDPGGPNTDADKMTAPVAIVYDPAGNLLVLNEFSKNVLKFNGTTGSYIGPFLSTADLGAIGITDPDDMEAGTDGNLYIMSHFNEGGNSVHRFNATTGAYVGVFTSPGETFHHQHGLAFGTAGDLFQGSVDGKLVERFNGATGAS